MSELTEVLVGSMAFPASSKRLWVTVRTLPLRSTRISLQTLLNQTRKAWESAAPVGMAGRKPYAHVAGDANHRRSSMSRTRASSA
jgi:hypothetical protein